MAERDEILVINFQEGRMWDDCPMCGKHRRLDHAVSWDCGPVHYETGAGMVVCRECHERVDPDFPKMTLSESKEARDR